MASIKLMKLNRNLSCLICNNDNFKHQEEKIQIANYSGYMRIRDGYTEMTLERVSCKNCGWSITFENDWNIDLNGYIVVIEE